MIRIIFVTILVPLIVVKCQSINSFEIQTVVNFAKKIVTAEQEFIDSLAGKDKASALNDTLARMKETGKEIESFEKLLHPLERYYLMVNELRSTMEYNYHEVEIFERVGEAMYRIEKWYESYVDYTNERSDINEPKFNHWIKMLTSSKHSELRHTLGQYYYNLIALVPKPSGSVFHRISQKLPDMPQTFKCGHDLSLQQRVSYFYESYALHQIKGFVMTVYGFTLNTIINSESTDKSMYEMAEVYLIIPVIQYMLAARSAMKPLKRQLEACDAKDKTSETYTSFKGLHTNILINLIDTNPNRSCFSPCSHYKNVKPEKCYPGINYCSGRPCLGTLSDCSPLESKYKIQMCELPADSDERYDWYKEGNEYFGSPTACGTGSNLGTLRDAKSFYGPDHSLCDICVCKCTADDSNLRAVRSVSFRPQIAAIEDNMVLTGVRFIEADGLIHIQIKQGKLINNGRIDPTTVAWKKLEKMRYVYTVESVNGSFDVYNEENNAWEEMTKSEDYVTLDYNDQFLYLDRIFVNDGYVMTGARWNRVPDKSNIIIQIEIHATHYDLTTGKLSEDDSIWITPQMVDASKHFYDRKREQMNQWGRTNPLKAPFNKQVSLPNQIHRFESTGSSDDAGQHTIPYFDTQPVETNPPIAIEGLEIYVRGFQKYGGFLTLRLFAVDLSNTWIIKFSSDEFSKYKDKFSERVMFSPDD